MNVFTATMIYKNYGSALQAYALQYVLKIYGASPYVLQKKKRKSRIRKVAGRIISKVIFILRPNQNYNIIKKIKLIVDDMKYERKYDKINQFINSNISLFNLSDERTFLKGIPDNSIFLSGSDQVWNTPLKLRWFAFQWAKDKKHFKYSYAASIGRTKFSEDKLRIYQDAFSTFEIVSLRESQAVDIFRPLLRIKVRQDLDPTLLLDKSIYKKIESPRLVDGPYIFVYKLLPNDKIFDLARKVAKELHCKIVYTGLDAYNVNDIQTVYDAGVEDFLSYIDYADAVVTNSFHGTAFSIIYEKPFLSVKVTTTGSRAESLLSLLGLQSQYIKDTSRGYSLQIDYTSVNKTLKEARGRSLEYLRSICKQENQLIS